MKPEPQKPSWKIRQKIIFATLIYCAAMIFYLAIWAESTPLREQVVLALVGLVASVIGAYIFGATWDDKNVMRREASLSNPHTPYDGALE